MNCDVPIFEQIEELKTDSADIKKYIRKVNYDMIGYYCDHDIYQMSCSRCDAARRKYKYSLFQIDRMREELKEQQEIEQQYIETPDENKYDLLKQDPSSACGPLISLHNFWRMIRNICSNYINHFVNITNKIFITNPCFSIFCCCSLIILFKYSY